MFSARTSKGEISIHEKVKKYKVEIIIIIIKDRRQLLSSQMSCVFAGLV